MQTLAMERTVQCQSDVAPLWTALSDTERTNRLLGMSKIAVRFNPSSPDAARFIMTTRLGGFTVSYDEQPFEWRMHQSFGVRRRMRQGPLLSLAQLWRFRKAPSGTEVTIQIEITPRYRWASLLGRRSLKRTIDGLVDLTRRIDQAILRSEPLPSVPAKVDEVALTNAAKALRQIDSSQWVDRLISHVRTVDDVGASRIRPFVLADAWGADRTEVLNACLRAVKAGLLELHWELICPSCQGAASSVPTLASLADHGECPMCEVRFDADLDQSLEVTFSPVPKIRRIDSGPYCIGGPARAPHVVSQAILPSFGQVTLWAGPGEGSRRVFLRGGQARRLKVVRGAAERLELTTDQVRDESELGIAPDGELVLKNSSSKALHAKIEAQNHREQAATAALVTSMTEFRRDFSSEVLRTGLSLKVSHMGLLFTDLTDSTRLYSRVGDAAAFKLVQDHFEVIRPIVERHRGAVVKTMGDAVMAAFVSDFDGLAAAIEIALAFGPGRPGADESRPIRIKLGLYSGACFILTANGVLDYFGQTVNIAARLQAKAHSDEIVVEEGFADQAVAQGAIRSDWIVERAVAELKGVDRPIPIARIRPAARKLD